MNLLELLMEITVADIVWLLALAAGIVFLVAGGPLREKILFGKFKLRSVVSCALTLLVGITTIIAIQRGGGGRLAQEALDQMLTAAFQGNLSETAQELVPEESWNYLLGEDSMTEAEAWEWLGEEGYNIQSLTETLQEEYGEDLEVSWTTVNESDYLSEAMSDLRDRLQLCGVDSKSVQDGKSVQIAICFSENGSVVAEDSNLDIELIKIGRHWYWSPTNLTYIA